MSDNEGLEDELGVPIPGAILPPEQWAKTGIKKLPDQGPIEWPSWFGRSAPVVLDVGCGNGRSVISSAIRRPDYDHVGIDILPVVIRYATRRGNQRGLHNTRFAVCDGERFLREYVAPRSVEEMHVYHPQPVHVGDRRSPHSRLLQPEFLASLHRSLCESGKLFLQTDSLPYWKYLQEVLPSFFAWHEHAEPWLEDPSGRTRREIQARQMGLRIYRGIGVRISTLSDEQAKELVATLPRPKFESDRRKKPRR
jgi:tRNA (guanine-N7-)-methyltransferase